MKKLFYDLETTGTNHYKNGVRQIAGLIEIDGQVVEEFDLRVRPHEKAKIEPEALSTSGVTEAEIMQYPPMSEVYKVLMATLAKYVNKYDPKDKFFLLGYNNTSFDDDFLRMWLSLCGDDFFGSWFWSGRCDVMPLAMEYLEKRRAKMPSFKLFRVAMELGLEVDKSRLHDGTYDVYLTRQIYRIVTGRQRSPFYYYIHPESGSAWKQYDRAAADENPDGLVQEVDRWEYLDFLESIGVQDSANLIQDDLL